MTRSKQNQKKTKPNEEENLSIVQMFQELKKDIQNLKDKDIKDLKDNFEQVKEILQNDIKTTKDRITHLEHKYATHQTELEKVNQLVFTLQSKIVKQETYIRRNNLIFEGVDYKDDENCMSRIRRIMIEILKIDDTLEISIDKCHRLFKPTGNSTKPPPIICRFTKHADRDKVWSCRFELKNTKIVMKEDFPQEVINKRKQLLPIMMQAKSLKMKAHLKDDTLIVNNESYTVETLQNLPDELNPIRLSTRQSDDILAFFTSSNPLSNFYDASFSVEGKKFANVEQFYQYKKALECGNHNAANKIMKSTSPGFCKRTGDLLVTSPEWNAYSIQILYTGCKAKFTQNEYPRKYLLESDTKTIAEASKNNFFGIGLELNDANVLNPNKWSGRNELGNILMRIRQELSN
jgi:ribA/ribD-fused uncharacterized protein